VQIKTLLIKIWVLLCLKNRRITAMKKNLGPVDRLIRVAAVFALLAIGFFAPLASGWRAFFFILAGLELVSAAAAY
jgi:fatty acid desaturase